MADTLQGLGLSVSGATAMRRLRCPFALKAAAVGLLTAGLVGLSLIPPPRPLLVWNASASAPIGLYAVSALHALSKGDMVIARMPVLWQDFAARRHYLATGIPLVKRIAAVEGDRICGRGQSLLINGKTAATRLLVDGQGRGLTAWQGCLTLRPGMYLLLTDKPGSFDGRYFGPTNKSDLIGRAVPLWVG